QAMQENDLKRYIVVTGLNVDTPKDNKAPKVKFATDWMYQNYPKTTTDRQDEYELLVKSKADWTLVRVPMIKLTDESKEIKISLEDCLGDEISATDLADFLIEQINDHTYCREAPFIANS
ncbi:MAG: NAD(P)H-binding protein, partial [Flavobacteriaceae bacterium]